MSLCQPSPATPWAHRSKASDRQLCVSSLALRGANARGQATIREQLPGGPTEMVDARTLPLTLLNAAACGLDVSSWPDVTGRYTDDTEALLSLADSLVECGCLDGEHAALTLCFYWARTNRGGYSAWTFAKLAALHEGTALWDQVGKMHGQDGSTGNGGLMRIAPVGLVYRHHAAAPDAMRAVVRTALCATHCHDESTEAATMLALAVARICNGDDVSRLELIRGLVESCNVAELKQRLQAVCDKLAVMGSEPFGEIYSEQDKVEWLRVQWLNA